MAEEKQLFDFMIDRVREVGVVNGLRPPQAFARWFADLYFQTPQDFFASDGSGDAKVDLFFQYKNGKSLEHCILNTKFTEKYNTTAPVSFYDEIIAFWQAFANKNNRDRYLSEIVRVDLRTRYKKLFHHFDEGTAKLYFVTNFRRNERQLNAVRSAKVDIFHLDEILPFMQDNIEDAMPHTPPLLLTGINTVLSAGVEDSLVPTSIVFARLSDFIAYMEDDLFELLFARNVRLSLGNTQVNSEIKNTFINSPKEFAFSNNGITLLCESFKHEPGKREVVIVNPRIVNGSQTLHSIRDVPNPASSARVMLRIIQIPPAGKGDLPAKIAHRKDVIHKISIRSNRQNTIKNWDLVSTDDFQHEIARYFRSKRLFYERRRKEWTHRRTELKSLGIGRGPDNKTVAQLISSFFWKDSSLGPVTAKRELGQLFDEPTYSRLKKAPVDLVYQLYLLDCTIKTYVNELAKTKDYVSALTRHMQQTLFSLVVKSLDTAKLKWRSAELTEMLENDDGSSIAWRELIAALASRLREHYYDEAKSYRRTSAQSLPLSNFFKSHTYVGRILERPIPLRAKSAAKRIVAGQ